MTHSHLTIFAGHYGSGKTNLAINYAVMLKQAHPDCRVILADLDVVNPYFRSADSEDILNRMGIEVIASEYAGSNLEAPSIPSGVLTLFNDESCFGVIDVGGDDRGAYAIGRYSDYIRGKNANILLVCNKYRPLSREPRQVLLIKDEIENAAHICFTGIVNNSNLGRQTTPDDIISSGPYINELSKLCNLPVVYTVVMRALTSNLSNIPGLFAIDIYGKKEWEID